MKLIQILEALNPEENTINASYFMKDARKNNSLYRIMSLEELSMIYADDWGGFLTFKEDTEDSKDGEITEYEGFSNFKSFAYKISKQQFRDWLDPDSVIVEFDLNTIANLAPGCKLVPYTFEKDGTKEYEMRLLANSFSPLGKLGDKAINAIKMIYVPASRANSVIPQIDDYFDQEMGQMDEYMIVKGI